MKKNTPYYAVIILAFLGKVIYFIRNNPQLYFYWDWPGHIDKALKLGWPWHGGWDITFWGGYPTLTYPSLSHYLLKLFISLPIPKISSLEIFILIVFIFQILTYLYLIHKRIKSPNHRLLAFIIFIIFTLILPGKYLGSLRGVIISGGFTANIASSLLFLLLATENPYAQALLMGLLIQTHTLTATIGFLYLGCNLFIKIIDYRQHLKTNKSAPVLIKHSFLGLLFSIGIGSPWIITALDPNFKGIATTIGTDDFLLPLLLIGAVLLVIVTEKIIKPFQLTLLIITILTALPMNWGYELSKLGVQGLHTYRYLYYLCFLIPIILLPLIITDKFLKNSLQKLFITLTLIGIIILEKTTSGGTVLMLDNSKFDLLEGRMVNVTSSSNTYDLPHMLNHEIPTQSNLLGTVGLFFESSQYGMLYYEFINQINPFTFKNGTYSNLYRNDEGKQNLTFDITKTANLLGINYVTFTPGENRLIATNSATIIGRLQNDNHEIVPIYLKQISDTPLIEPLTQLPIYNPSQNLGDWWVQTNHQQLYTKNRLDQFAKLNFDQPKIDFISYTPTTIHFKINSDQLTPTSLKFTYNKYWEAKPTDQNSFVSNVYWISPGHLFIIGKGDILLTWHQPKYLLMLYALSAVLIVYTLKKVRERNSLPDLI